MPAIYTEEWYDAIVDLANSRDDISQRVPQGEWRVAIEIEGDSKSPYILEGTTRYFLVRFLNGKVAEYRESAERIPGKGLHYRVIGPASLFDGIAAGVVDPVEVGLNGSVTIRGDMRVLMQHADMVNAIFEMYTQSNVSEWPLGKPPYG